MLRAQKFTKQNKEHVFFSLKKKLNLNKIKEKLITQDLSHLNFSIDYVEDYLKIKKKMKKLNI